MTSALPAVTVAVPSYRHARYVEACLRSIFAQTHAPSRLIVIDDGSNDGSPAVIERALRDCPFPSELIVQANRGLCATLNRALGLASDPLFAYLGSDDLWEPRRLEEGARALAEQPDAVLAYGHAYILDAQGARVGSTLDWAEYRGGNVFWDLMRGESVPLSPTTLFRRAPLARIGWEEASSLEDYELYLKLAWEGPFAFVPSVFGGWRKHDSNTSHRTEAMLREILAAQDRVARRFDLDRQQVARASRSLRFRFADNFLAHGDRWTAARLSVESLRGAPNGRAILRRAARLLTPRRVLAWRKDRLERQARARWSRED